MIRISEIIQSITDESQFDEQVEIIDNIIRQDNLKDSKKNETRSLLMFLADIVNDGDSSPTSKYYCIRTVKHFADKGYNTFVSDLAHSALYEDMIRFAKTVDPQKQPENKGKRLFPGEPEIGSKFIVLIEECIVDWARKYPMIGSSQASKFKKGYEDLKKLNVVLPDAQNSEIRPSSFHPYAEYSSSYRPPVQENQQHQPGYYNILAPDAGKKEPEADVNNFFAKIEKPSPFEAIKNEFNQLPDLQSKKFTQASRYRKPSKSNNNSMKSQDVFGLFPNVKLNKNDYDGTIVSNTLPYWEQMSQLQPDELKRFKFGCFKEKNILYQDEYLQIGFKSKLIYQNVESFKVFLKMIIYYDNKTPYNIVELENEFEGDQTNLLYSTKKQIDKSITPDDQIAQELLIVPLDIPMNLIQMRMKYSCRGTARRVSIFLPSTVLKFTTFKEVSKSQLSKRMQQRKSSIFRTDPFKLSRYFPPNIIKKSLPSLVQITNYNEFMEQKNYAEYELGGYCEVVKSEEYFIRIIIRIDAKAVVQVLPVENGQHGNQYGKVLLQTLQFLLQQDSL